MDRNSRLGIDKSGEDGIAYGFIFMIIFIIMAAFTIMVVYQLENTVLTEIINPFVADGSVSEQTYNSIRFNQNMTMGLPIVALLGAFIWSVMRGVSGRTGMPTSSGAFYTGWVILVTMCVLGFMMSFLGGTVIDRMYDGIDAAGLYQSASISAEWNAAQEDGFNTFSNAYYFLCYLCPILGAIVFVKSVVFQTYGNRYTDYGGGF